ncbi:MAG TPA: MFS transporter [Thermoflexales bacterium]|nr:MFS transporter [Thermoflexales bacterium]HQW34730.1 MFS transporter [Thermoflexales bacterium]HQX75698.1 MFS transporter [Thermoflexales bacterium]HQZ22543.1 MFS transporter [Thermoflexales bacterium]HRA01442.1 MFS transporter [Thermoflexales bacterium]
MPAQENADPAPEAIPKNESLKTLIWRYRFVHLFQSTNAMSYQIALGSPLILFAREMGASAAAIGLISGFTPLLSTLQLFMARRMERVGYRQTMLSGWTARVLTLLALCAMPFLAVSVPHETIVWLIVAAMFLFNFTRGLATGAWLPWVTALVPRTDRGGFLSRDRMFINIASVVSLGISGAILSSAHNPPDSTHGMGYAAIFGLSFGAGAVSLFFLSRIQNPPSAHQSVGSNGLAWREILKDKEFRAFTLFTLVWQVVVASSATFTIVFSREEAGLSDGALVWLSAGAALMAMIGLQVTRPNLDRRGSKFFMRLVLGWWAIHFSVWLLMALRVIPTRGEIAAALMLGNGIFLVIFDTAATRLLMNLAGDRPGTTQYFAVQQVQINVAGGLAPILWGVILDSLRDTAFDRFAVFFAAQIALVGVMALMQRRVREA